MHFTCKTFQADVENNNLVATHADILKAERSTTCRPKATFRTDVNMDVGMEQADGEV